MTRLEELTNAAVAQIAAAKTPREAQQIAEAFSSDGYESLEAWHNALDVGPLPVGVLVAVWRDISGQGDKPDAALAEAIARVDAAYYERSRK